jgi:condensin complex subunit 1
MIVSRDLCQRHLTVLFDFLESPHQNQKVSCAIMIFLGDLFRRFPNHLTVHVVRMFSLIRSPLDAVRQTAFIVLSHLILNDFIKIKSEIAEFIFLLEDPDVRIQELTSIFFHEMTEKNKNFILNILPDAISRLSSPPESGGLTDKDFETFAKHFLKFISKDHVSDHLIEKMMVRVRQIESEREIRNTIYCVYCLVSNEKMLDKLVANAEKLRNLLAVSDVQEILNNLIFKLRAHPKMAKEKIDEFENLLFKSGDQVFEEFRRRKDVERFTNMKKANGKKKLK